MIYGFVKNMSAKQAVPLALAVNLSLTSTVFFYQRHSGPDNGGKCAGEPRTTSAEWEAASVEYGKAQHANPIRHFRQ